ncbi:MAG: DNA translocase FtsK [Nautiliaceae bacterium]
MKKSVYIFLFSSLFYLFVSTIFPKISVVGKVGAFLGKTSFLLFGYLSYIFPFLLGVLLVLAYKKRFDYTTSLRVLGGVFLFFDLLFFQAMVFKVGVIGNLFVNTLKFYIGLVGVGLLVLVIFIWSLFLLFEEEIISKIYELKNRYQTLKNSDSVESNEAKNEIKQDFDKSLKETPKTQVESQVKIEEIKEVFDFSDFDVSNVLLDEDDIKTFEKPKEKSTEEVRVEVKEDSFKENNAETVKTKNSEIQNNLEDNEVKEIKIEEKIKDTKDEKESKIEKAQPAPKVTHVEELEDTKKLLSEIETGEREHPSDWVFPPLDFLKKPPAKKKEVNEAEIDKKIKTLIEKLKQFKIEGDVVRYYVGPVVTTFEFKPLPHIKVSKILALQDDLAMALKAQSIRIQAPIPGKDVVGIEIPNDEVETIYLREILESDIFKKAKSPLTLALGKDIVGAPFVTDLKKLPHLLIAGTTGSGKSVGINAMILSLLYRNSPDELKFVMIDPKMLEFSIFNDIPHLLTPVITEPKKAITALNAMVKEMERRYKLMAKARVKNIENYNNKLSKEEKLPYIVIIIDELADLMMTSGKDVEYSIARLAQMARASGIHLIVATQRPSVDVVTGLIKANLPSRISFKVGQKIDSKVILDQYGAETLLGRGDMLFTPPGISGLIRLHAPFTSEEEIEKVVEYLKSQREADYDTTIISQESEVLEEVEDLDELFEEAKEIILKEKRTSISYLQRRLQIGYNRAANIIEQMERMGILSPPNSKGQREILI